MVLIFDTAPVAFGALGAPVTVLGSVTGLPVHALAAMIGRQLPVTMLETTGRKSGQPRRTAVGGSVVDNQFWMVSEHGDHSDYVYNIKANPAVRVRIKGQWRSGTAHLLPDGRAANHPDSVVTFSPPMEAPLPGAVVNLAVIFSPASSSAFT